MKIRCELQVNKEWKRVKKGDFFFLSFEQTMQVSMTNYKRYRSPMLFVQTEQSYFCYSMEKCLHYFRQQCKIRLFRAFSASQWNEKENFKKRRKRSEKKYRNPEQVVNFLPFYVVFYSFLFFWYLSSSIFVYNNITWYVYI